MTDRDQETLLRTAHSATMLGNSISLKMVEFLNKVKDQPAGFRDLGLDFLSICQILNSLEGGLQEHFTSEQPFPQKAIAELMNALAQTLGDFTKLESLLQKFMDYEKGGTFATLQKTWRHVFADKDIAKIRHSLQANKGTLTMTMLLTNIHSTPSSSPVGYEYDMLAAKLENQASGGESTTEVPSPSISELHADRKLRHELPDNKVLSENPISMGAVPAPALEETASTSIPFESDEVLTPSFSEISLSEKKVESPFISTTEQYKEEPSESVKDKIKTVEEIATTEPEERGNEKFLTSEMPQRIRVDRSQIPKRAPKNAMAANTASLQKSLAFAVDAQKHKIAEQLLERGVSPDTGPEKNALILATYNADVTSLKLLLEFGADPNIKDRRGDTPLRCASEYNREEEAKLLLEYGANPNISSPDWTSLPWAINDNKEKLVSLLLRYGANPDFIMENGETSMIYACDRDILPSIIQEMLSYGADPNAKNAAGRTPLWAACCQKRPEIVKMLLSKGANPDLPGPELPVLIFVRDSVLLELLISAGADVHTYKGLMELATNQNSIESVKLLLDAGVNPNDKKDGIFTPLTTAIRDNHPEILALLLSRGANPNLKGQDEPLMMATKRPEFLKQLLASGADLSLSKGIMEMAVLHNSLDSVKLLIDAGVNPNDKKDGIFTPITTAIRDNRPNILTLLLSHGADLDLKGQDIPLHMATKRPEILEQLIASGADLAKYKGIMEMAVYHNSIESVGILLDAGVDPNEKKDDIYSPVTTAIRDNRPEILSLLLSRGADPNLKGQELPLVMAVKSPVLLQQLIASGAKVSNYEGLLELAVAYDQIESVKILIEAGVPLGEKHRDLHTPLTTAVRDNRVPILKLLLASGADPNESGEGLPITIAARFKDSERLHILLEAGADVNGQSNGTSALIQACEHNAEENVKLLLQKGADVNLADGRGNTAMDFAANKGHDDIVMLLLEAME